MAINVIQPLTTGLTKSSSLPLSVSRYELKATTVTQETHAMPTKTRSPYKMNDNVSKPKPAPISKKSCPII